MVVGAGAIGQSMSADLAAVAVNKSEMIVIMTVAAGAVETGELELALHDLLYAEPGGTWTCAGLRRAAPPGAWRPCACP